MATAAIQPQVTVRAAWVSDAVKLLPMLKEFDQFASQKHKLYSNDVEIAGIIGNLIQTQPFLIAERDRELIGCFAALVTPHIFNPRIRVLTELFWWVKPEYRGTRAGLLLLETMTQWAKQNVDMFVMTLEHHSPVRPQTLTKRGFQMRETNYILEV